MWIFTDTGFISAVRKPEYPGVFTVRSRDRESLESLAAKAQVEIKRSPNGDYPYRVFVSDSSFIEWFLDRGGELQYSNFKNRVAQTRGKHFVSALHNVWEAMLAVEDDEARSPLVDADGNHLSHSDATAQLGINEIFTKVPENFSNLSEQEQIAWSERAAEKLCEGLSGPEITEVNWSEEEKNY
jgi:hypothetical protein